MEKPTTNAPTRTGCLYSPNRREKLSEKGPEATLDPLFLAPKAAKQGYCEPFRRLLGFSWRPIGTFRTVSLETVRKGYEQRSARGFGWYTEDEMDRKAPLCRPIGLRYKCVRGFSDSLSRHSGE